eukprot:5635340-Prymnesium_polylepis.1
MRPSGICRATTARAALRERVGAGSQPFRAARWPVTCVKSKVFAVSDVMSVAVMPGETCRVRRGAQRRAGCARRQGRAERCHAAPPCTEARHTVLIRIPASASGRTRPIVSELSAPLDA